MHDGPYIGRLNIRALGNNYILCADTSAVVIRPPRHTPFGEGRKGAVTYLCRRHVQKLLEHENYSIRKLPLDVLAKVRFLASCTKPLLSSV